MDRIGHSVQIMRSNKTALWVSRNAWFPVAAVAAHRVSEFLPAVGRVHMKKIYAVAFFLNTAAFAQQSVECQLMQQRVSGKSSEPKLCLAIYQQCSENAKHAANVQVAQAQCSAGLGQCQMGGVLSGESLQQAIEQYKKMCEKSIQKLPTLGASPDAVSSH